METENRKESWFKKAFKKRCSNLEVNSSNCRAYCDIMKYPLILMRIVGLYHRKNDKWYFKAYTFSIIVILWLSFARLFSLFEFWYGGSETLSAKLVYKIVFILWCFVTVTSGTIFFINQEKNSRENQLIHEFSYYLDKYSNKKIKILKRKILFYFLIGVFASSLNSFSQIQRLFYSSSSSNIFKLLLAPFHKEDWSFNSQCYKILSVILLSYTSFFWTLTIFYFLAHCEIISFIINNFNHDFRNLVKNRIFDFIIMMDNEFEKNFDKLRIKHLEICNLIQIMNKSYKEFIGINLLIYINIMLMILFIMTDWKSNLEGIMSFLYPFWAVNSIFFIFLIIWFGARIQNECSSLMNDLLEVNLAEFNNSLCFRINLMIFKLAFGMPQLTAFGTIKINNEFLLKVFGTLISYFIIMYQFKNSIQ